MSDNKVVRVEIEDQIAKIVLCNPKKLNSMGVTFQADLIAAATEVDENEEVRVAVLMAEGKSFCAGLDLMALAMVEPAMMSVPSPAADKGKILKVIRDFQDAMTILEKCKKPIIAAVNGHCIGGGLDLIAACDVRIASKDAIFSLRETRVAIMADIGSLQRLPRIIGEGHTRQLAYTAEDITAERACKINLVNDVYEDKDELIEKAMEMARLIAKNAPLCVQTSKEVLNWGRGRTVEDSLEYVAVRNQVLLPTEDLMEAIQAFMGKREPNYKGR